MQDSMIIRSANSTPSTTPRAADGAAVSGMAPSSAVRGSANQSGPRSGRVCGMNTGASCHLRGSAAECRPDQCFDRHVAVAVAETLRTVGQGVAAVDDTVDQPAAGADVDALQGAGAGVGGVQGVGHHVRGSHDQQRPAAGLGAERVGGGGGVGRSDQHRNPGRQAAARRRSPAAAGRARSATDAPAAAAAAGCPTVPGRRRATGRTRRCWPSGRCRTPGWGRSPVPR